MRTEAKTASYQSVLAGTLALLAWFNEQHQLSGGARDQVYADAQRLSIDAKSGLRVIDGWPFTGVAIQQSANGVTVSEERYERGRRHGVLRRWFDNGRLAFASEYRHGRREGETIGWWRNGTVRSFATYKDDRPDGIALQWYRGGERFKQLNYDNGRPAGLQRGWRVNGKLFSNFEYREGRTYGLRNANLCVGLSDEELVFSD